MSPQQKKPFQTKQDEEDRKTFDKKWERLNSKVKSSQPNFEEPKVPFASAALIRDYNELYSKIYDKEKFVNL